jgi:hypothetical protein
MAAIPDSFTIIFSIFQVLIGYLTEPAKHMPVIEFPPFEIAGAAERNGTGMTKEFPLSLRGLDRGRGIGADDRFRGDETAIDEIKSQGHETGDFGHRCLPCNFGLTLIFYSEPA